MPNLRRAPADEKAHDQSVSESIRKASHDGAAWVRAEAELAQAELAEASRRTMMAAALAIITGAVALTALVVMALGAIALLAPVIGSAIAATWVVAAALILSTVLLGWWAWRVAVSTTEATTFIKRWSDALSSKRQRRA